MDQLEATHISDPWGVYIWWGLILILEVLALTWFTGRHRVNYKVIHSKEDELWFDDKSNLKLDPAGGGHPKVDKIRNAHFSAIEFMAFYVFIVPLWILTEPENLTAQIVLRLLPLSQILYTIVYMDIVRVLKNFKLLFLAVNYVSSIYILISNMVHYFKI